MEVSLPPSDGSHWTVYPVTSAPPSFPGGSQDTSRDLAPRGETVRLQGMPGGDGSMNIQSPWCIGRFLPRSL